MHQLRNYTEMQSKMTTRIMNTSESDILLSNFPITRLSYEVSIHKNDTQFVASVNDYKCFILPKGRRCIAWATEWKRNRVFAFIEIDGTNRRQDRDRDRDRVRERGDERPFIRKFHQENGWYPGRVRILDACFDRTLVYGTVFGGVMFRNLSSSEAQYFSIHTIYWYKGNPVLPLTGLEHIRLCEELFYHNNIRQVAYTKENSVIFGLPVLCNTEQDARRVVDELPYETFAIQYRYITNTRVFQRMLQDVSNIPNIPKTSVASINLQPQSVPSRGIVSTTLPPHTTIPASASASKQLFIPPSDEMLTNIQATFIVRPNIQNDIYELYVMSDISGRSREPQFHNFALIPSFKTSVMMNRLFRNISENQRLDTMEESENEADFENIEPDKYVTLTKEYNMVCRFNKRFCKWVPIEITTRNDIITAQHVKQHEVRYVNHRRCK